MSVIYGNPIMAGGGGDIKKRSDHEFYNASIKELEYIYNKIS